MMAVNANARSIELRQHVIELLANYVDRPSLVRLSRVSWAWNAAANAVLWRHLRSFLPLLRLLRPQKEQGIWGFANPICAGTLARFDRIAALVQSFEWSEKEWTREWLESFVPWAHMLRAVRPTQDLLPNLRWLRASCETLHGVQTIVPWLSASVSSIDITLGLAADDMTGTYLLSALERCSTHITSFSLRMDSSPSRRRFVEHELVGVLRNLTEVRRVTIPLPASPGKHLDALSAAPHLEELAIFVLESPAEVDALALSTLFEGTAVSAMVDEPLDALDSLSDHRGLPEPAPSLQASQHISNGGAGPFPSLHTLEVTGSLVDIANVVQDTTHNLERLHLCVPSIQNEHEMTRAMQDIAAFCPHLRFIAIEFFSPDHPEWVDLDPLNRRPLEIHTRHPRLYPDFLVWRQGDDGVVETEILPDHA